MEADCKDLLLRTELETRDCLGLEDELTGAGDKVPDADPAMVRPSKVSRGISERVKDDARLVV